jgi:hypothetical protein
MYSAKLSLKGPSLCYIIHFLQCFLPPKAHAELSLPVCSSLNRVLDQTRFRVLLAASRLEVHSSKCPMFYCRRLKQDLLGTRGRGVKEKGLRCYCVLTPWSASMSSCPVAMVNLTVARTESIFDVHLFGSDGRHYTTAMFALPNPISQVSSAAFAQVRLSFAQACSPFSHTY